MKEEEICLNFENIKAAGKTKLPYCPYNESCDGKTCDFTRQSKKELKEDIEQEKAILAWRLNLQERN